ncbi:MAG: hypothetical protein V4857_31905 [Pseudomonadota bacterium]
MAFSITSTHSTETRDSSGAMTSSSVDYPDAYMMYRNLVCPSEHGYFPITTSGQMICKKDTPPAKPPEAGGQCSHGNPIHSDSGLKTEHQIDYATPDNLLVLERRFMGQFKGWSMPGGRLAVDLFSEEAPPDELVVIKKYTQYNPVTGALVLSPVETIYPIIKTNPFGEFHLINSDGSHTIYIAANAEGIFLQNSSGNQLTRLGVETAEGAIWRVTRRNNVVEEYGTDGRLRKRQQSNGNAVIYTYVGEFLNKMQDNFGRQIVFSYNADGTLARATLPDDLFVEYSYENRLLTRVTHADGTSRQFRYNEPAFIIGAAPPVALTGTIDENGVRAGTYKYANGLAVSTERANGLDRYLFEYQANYTYVTNPLNTKYLTYYNTVAGEKVVSSSNQPPGAGCSSSSSSLAYNLNGNVTTRTDFNGVNTTYKYDLIRSLETSRVEAAGTLLARTVSTQWHGSLPVPLTISEPRRRTTFTYNVNGQVLTKAEQATSDATGAAGMAATLIGPVRRWVYSYTDAGRISTVTGPRTDIVDKTSYGYDDKGNLVTVSNAMSQTTTLSNYDINGRVGRISDPNGLVTDLTYTARGYLKTRNVGGRTTVYDYEKTGLVKKVTMPDQSSIDYVYDDARRLTSIQDSQGNTISYTLDAMGNRTKEQTKDASGTLVQQTSRIYDALNRLQQVTGGTQ